MCYAKKEKILKYDKKIQNEWHDFKRKNIFELYFGKKTRKKPNKGDLFAVEILENIYVYGQVLETQVKRNEKQDILVIYDYFSYGLNLEGLLKANYQVLVAPFITGDILFNNGFLQLLEVKKGDIINDDYNFYTYKYTENIYTFRNKDGEVMKEAALYTQEEGLMTDYGIYSDIIFSLITNKELLVIDGVDYKFKLYDLLKGKKIDYPEEYLPFKVDAEQSISLLYETKEQYQYDIFKEMIPDYQGSGYEWEKFIITVAKTKMPRYVNKLKFDTESDQVCVYTISAGLIKRLAKYLVAVCENEKELKKHIKMLDNE